MALTKPKYPLDRTGQSAANRVIGEERTVDKQFNRAFSPFGGPFYGDSMVVTDKASGKTLELGTDYTLIYPYVEATQNLGLPVYNLVNLVNRTYDNVILTYQVVGGVYSYSVDAIVKMMNELLQDDRVVSWGNLWGKPLAFNPTQHLHAATDLYSLEYVVLALEELTRAVIQGDVASHNVIYEYINRVREQVYEEIAKLKATDADLYANVTRLDGRIDAVILHLNAVELALNNHKADKNNPHAVTQTQVGLGLVQNYRVATQTEAETGTLATAYMTPLLTWQALTKFTALNITPVIQAHINDKGNPHQVTKAQTGLGSVENYGVATQLDAETGTSNVLYTTPLRVAQAIAKQALVPLNTHIANQSNPHNVTKAQVGLGSVLNYGIASQAQAEAGADATTYMTPQRVGQAINRLALVPLNNHIGNQSNPHNVTKAQVGLGSVDNFRTASTAETNAGTSTTLFVTPAGVNANAARQDAAWVAQLRAEMANMQNSLQNQINNIRPTIDVRIANGDAVSGLVAGARYLVFVDGVVNHGGSKGGVWLDACRVHSSSGAILDQTSGRSIDNPDGNAPYASMMYVTCPADGYLRASVENTGWNISRTVFIRCS